MVKWTEEERRIIRGVWEKVDIDEIGEQLWARALIVYPWIERYFGGFGDIFTTTAILNNPKLSALGKVVLTAVDNTVKNMDNFKEMYDSLSRLHYEKIKVDPDNFRLLAECITIIIACKLKAELNPQVQATWQKFLSAVVEAMSSQYK
ncbi:hemoglobin subunit beta-1-like [Cyprinodon tularosa]|uniref:Hemoglobin, beta adult 2 n=1 Tax=Cyprinodon variegatus TaxID=28743 RepID=A0A3Q2E6A0_CYPVA|nr:PREDICTED: hemoglobin subunit beta-1-like [Cyprinodon variegatus]XP_038143750.1 hemoglobin subunit beta-1-like [Cyprinodon tularosa]